jgi:hypothetical protein
MLPSILSISCQSVVNAEYGLNGSPKHSCSYIQERVSNVIVVILRSLISHVSDLRV